MATQVFATNKLIQFSCQYCRVSLTVDVALAGVTGPCPSCGLSITAPESGAAIVGRRELKKKLAPSVREEVAPGSSVQEQKFWPEPSPRRRSEGSAVTPNTELSESCQERIEIATAVKMAVAGLVALGLVLMIVYLLKFAMA
ncbi:MAG: hypothetical protein ACON5H_10590 [Akkermansiaceae bacterium]